MRKVVLYVALLMAGVLYAPAMRSQATATVLHTNITNVTTGDVVAAGKECLTPVDGQRNPTPGNYSGGTFTKAPVCHDIMNGNVAPFLNVPRTDYSNPGVCYAITITDSGRKNQQVIGPGDGYDCVKLDTTTIATSGGGTVDLRNISPYHSNYQLPQLAVGPQGPQGPQGPPGNGANSVSSTPSTSQTIAQPLGTSLNLNGKTLFNGARPISPGRQLNKVKGANPASMPQFIVANTYRHFQEIGPTYFSDFLTPAAAGVSYFANQPPNTTLGTITRDERGYTLAPSGGQAWGQVYEYKNLETPYETGSAIVGVVPTYTGSGSVIVYTSLTKNGTNWVNAEYNLNGNMLQIRVDANGTVTVLKPLASPSPLEPGDTLSLVIDGPFAYALQTKPNGARYRSGIANLKPYVDFRTGQAGLYRWGFGHQSVGDNNTTTFRGFYLSWFGGMGLRDFSWVKNEDGSPYKMGNLDYFTATVGGSNDGTQDAPFAGSYMGVFSFDPISYEIQLTGRVFWQAMNGTAPYVVGDHAGQLIFDRDYGYWLASATSFGSSDAFGAIGPVGNYLTDDPLIGTHVVYANQVTLPDINYPAISYSSWDHYWTKVTAGDGTRTWYIGVTLNKNGISVPAMCTAPDASPFGAAGCTILQQSTGVSREGSKIVNTGNGAYYFLIGQTNSNTVYTYSLSPFAEIGSFVTPHSTALGTPAQHADFITNYTSGGTQYFYLMFGTDAFAGLPYSWGTMEVARNTYGQELTGDAFDWARVPGGGYTPSATKPGLPVGSMSMQDASKIAPTSAKSVIACSSSGTMTFTQPFQGVSFKQVVAYSSACVGSVSYTFPAAFSDIPAVRNDSLTNGSFSATATAVVFTNSGAAQNGWAFILAF